MNKELGFVKEMFDKIAPKYDFLNHLLSFRQDKIWRTQMVKAAGLAENNCVMDVACGTCDVALEITARLKGRVKIIGLDFSHGMLTLGQKKIKSKENIVLVNGDALCLPFEPGQFDAVFIAFGIRNIMDRKRALTQFHKALKKGGKLVILELTTPEKGILRQIYLAYFKKFCLPLALFSKDNNAYNYLPESVLRFPHSAAFARTIKQAGFQNICFKKMTFGIVTLFVGTKE